MAQQVAQLARGDIGLGQQPAAQQVRERSCVDPESDAEQDRSPLLGRQAGTQKLGALLFELPPGWSTFRLHVHHANEELIEIVAGRPTLRTLDSERILEPAEVAACPTGHPESGKLWARNYPPGGEPGEEAVELIARPEGGVDYLDGEV